MAFCPEHVAQGHSLEEFRELPQIISAFDAPTIERVRRLFEPFTPAFVEMDPMEAELCKLMTNAWRYLQFAAVNQFYIIATERGLDFSRILHGCRYKYPRMAGMPGPGFAAGPCLVKDTMQLAAFSQNQFVLGHAAMLINEGLPSHLVNLARRQIDLSKATAAIVGMAFKAESDDRRDSLSYKLRKLLALECKQVLCTDPYVRDPQLVPLEDGGFHGSTLARSDSANHQTNFQPVAAAPHAAGDALMARWYVSRSGHRRVPYIRGASSWGRHRLHDGPGDRAGLRRGNHHRRVWLWRLWRGGFWPIGRRVLLDVAAALGGNLELGREHRLIPPATRGRLRPLPSRSPRRRYRRPRSPMRPGCNTHTTARRNK